MLKPTTFLSIAISLVASPAALAQTSTLPENQFSAAVPSIGQLIYSEYTTTFEEWRRSKPVESKALLLFPEYQEPPRYLKSGRRADEPETLMMYVAKSKIQISKPAAQVNVAAMINVENIAKLDTEIRHRQITAESLMPNVVGTRTVNNFDWCNSAERTNIQRPKKETNLEHLRGKPWCQSAGRSICLESCYIYPSAIGTLFTMLGLLDVNDPKDLGTASQSEIRYFVSEAEYGAGVSLREMTGINTQVTGVVEQSIFYFNQIFQYGKLVAVLQSHPADGTKTIMTSFLVLGVKQRSWKKYPGLPEALRYGLPRYKTGLLSGVPNYMQIMTQEFGKILSR